MTAADIIQRATSAGLSLRPLPDGRISCKPRDRLTPALAAAIKAHRAEVLAALECRLSATQEQQLRGWLTRIGETDHHAIEDTVRACHENHGAKAYLLRRARHAEALALLADRDRCFVIDPDLNPVTVTVGVAGVGIVDLEIPRDRWDPFLFAQYLESRLQ